MLTKLDAMMDTTADSASHDIKKSAGGAVSPMKNEAFERLPDEIIEQ